MMLLALIAVSLLPLLAMALIARWPIKPGPPKHKALRRFLSQKGYARKKDGDRDQAGGMSERTAYPLSWPEGWPRVSANLRRQSPFLRCVGSGAREHSMDEARRVLGAELERLGARRVILSTNVELRLDGLPYSNRSQPSDPGAAVYFELKGKATSLACDKWLRVEDNIWAMAKHVEALRGQQRWGVGSIDRAFAGYQGLPAVGESSASDWWKTLGVPVNATPEQVRTAYRLLVKKHHPDVGGDAELFSRIQRAMERFEATQRELVKEAA